MGAGAEVKVESGDEVEDYDGSYACLVCTESVRGTAALVCGGMQLQPVAPRMRQRIKVSRGVPDMQAEISKGVDGRERRAWRAERVR